MNEMRKEPSTITTEPDRPETLREQAIAELRKRREYTAHLLSYLMVNGFLVIVWWFTGADFFWPVFPMFIWGIGLVFHTWDVFWPTPREDKIRATMDRLSHR
jgi:hypothetical protein